MQSVIDFAPKCSHNPVDYSGYTNEKDLLRSHNVVKMLSNVVKYFKNALLSITK